MAINTEAYEKYFSEIKKEYKRGLCTELTHRSAIKEFIETINLHLELSGENKKIKGIGKPDFICFKKKIKMGYIETKDLFDISSEEGYKKIINSTQLIKYLNGAIPNLILTDYLRFVLIRHKEKVLDVTLFKKEDLDKGKLDINDYTIKQFSQLIESFLDYDLPTIKNSTDLAYELSKRAVLLRDLIKEQLNEDLEKIKNNEETSPVYEFYEAFKELIKDAKPDECVDAYAQTITYGLFLSKIGSYDGLNRDSAATYIPSSIKIIKKIFSNIAGDDLPSNCSWIVDEIIDILNAADIKKILSEFIFEGKHYKDPFIHFYEDFLKEYDPEKRKHLGVYYTPEPVVSFITNSINEILKKEFEKSTGFADDSVNVLDFATGTGTFLANSFVLALKEIRKAGLTGIEKSKIENHLLKHFYGFEILISPYVIAHLKLGLLLKQEGYELSGSERMQVYLTNTLDPQETITSLKGFLKELSQETMIANSIKKEKPILVVMGNPPYFKSSSNNSEWILGKLKYYKEGLKEKRLGNLDDDYVKFIRFAEWKIEQNGKGIMGLITNNSYLESPTFRKMREVLLKTFNKIYILNLHGSSNVTEVCPDGSKDENVFDIKQGVAICLMIKNEDKTSKVYYNDLWGLREKKYEYLYNNSISKTEWKEIEVENKFHFFCLKNLTGHKKYNNFISVIDIFKEYSSGLETKKDEFLVNFSKKELKEKLDFFISKNNSKNEIINKLKIKDIIIKDKSGKEKFEFNIETKREKLRLEGIQEDKIVKYLHRPFDYRWIYFNKELISRSRLPLSFSMVQPNKAICTSRFTSVKSTFSSALITDCLNDLKFCEYSRGCYFFPLYQYKDGENYIQSTLLGEKIKAVSGKQHNYKEEFLKFLSEQYPHKEISHEEIFEYIYAVLYSPIYRQKYHELLRIDFPRIPFVNDFSKFKKLSKLGDELIEIHLMKTPTIKNNTKFEISGSNDIINIKYTNKKVYINDTQFFDGISEDIWKFNIGGYQVLDKWLKSRKGRKLTHNEIETYIQIVNILSETLKLMNEIDKIKIE